MPTKPWSITCLLLVRYVTSCFHLVFLRLLVFSIVVVFEVGHVVVVVVVVVVVSILVCYTCVSIKCNISWTLLLYIFPFFLFYNDLLCICVRKNTHLVIAMTYFSFCCLPVICIINGWYIIIILFSSSLLRLPNYVIHSLTSFFCSLALFYFSCSYHSYIFVFLFQVI